MEHLVHVEPGDKDEARDLGIAKAVSEALASAYPNHFWIVSFVGHNMILRHALIANVVTLSTGREGFGSLLPRDKIGTMHEACETAVRFAGALLEAFRLPRGPWDGETLPQIPEDLLRDIHRRKQLRGYH